MPLSRLYEKPRSATKVRSFPVKVSTMDAEMKFDDIEVTSIFLCCETAARQWALMLLSPLVNIETLEYKFNVYYTSCLGKGRAIY